MLKNSTICVLSRLTKKHHCGRYCRDFAGAPQYHRPILPPTGNNPLRLYFAAVCGSCPRRSNQNSRIITVRTGAFSAMASLIRLLGPIGRDWLLQRGGESAGCAGLHPWQSCGSWSELPRYQP
jgi:hypothetical protein